MIPYGKQSIDESDIQAVVDVLRSDWLTQGPKIGEFERGVADYCEAKYAVACSSGTAALHLACLASNVKAGDEIITSPITFLATANAARFVGASVSFCDIHPETLNLDPELLADTMKKKPAKAVFSVDFAGLPCNPVQTGKIAEQHGALVIEDACHAFGARYKDEDGNWHRTGSCRHSTMTIFSFHPVKIMTTGEGGIITTNDKDLYERLCLLRNHGMVREGNRFLNKQLGFTDGEPNSWYYEMHEVGYNYRMTDIQAALGLSQLKRVDSFLKRRREIAEKYRTDLKGFPFIKFPFEPSGYESAYHLFPVEIEFDRLGVSRHDLMRTLREKDIGTQVHYIPVHLQPYYGGIARLGEFPNAERYYKRALSLPIYPSLTDRQIEYIVGVLSRHLESLRRQPAHLNQ